MKWRTLRVRVARSIALAVLGAVILFGVTSGTTFYLHERAEAMARHRSAEMEAAEERENRLLLLKVCGAMAAVIPAAMIGASAVGFWLAGRALAPMREAAERAKVAARGGTLELTLPVSGLGDEWDDLAIVMNELLRQQRECIERERAFSANAAHELRTPLTAMRGEVQVALRRERSAPEYRASLEAVEAEVQRLSTLVETLLTLARTESGEIEVSSVEFDMADVARASAERVRANSVSATRRKSLDMEVDAVATRVTGDPLLTGRILENLLENAQRYGARTIKVQVEPQDISGIVAVADDGPGVDARVRARLFERFNKAPGSRGGFGLGLAIARALACVQGGRLRLDETAGHTCFVLELPLAGSAGAQRARSTGEPWHSSVP